MKGGEEMVVCMDVGVVVFECGFGWGEEDVGCLGDLGVCWFCDGYGSF